MKATRASVLWLRSGLIVQDAFRNREYRIDKLLGQGGFGAAYRALRLTGATSTPKLCVLKVTVDGLTWHREAYFGHLLRHVPALVSVYDSFAWAPGGGRKPVYCLISEHMAEGDLDGYLLRNPQPWPEPRARREIVHLLRAVTMMHASGAVHRDITPRNVFVASNGALKLGDFGIALHRLGHKEVAADAFAPRFAPRAIQEGAKHWRQADAVHRPVIRRSAVRGRCPQDLRQGGEESPLQRPYQIGPATLHRTACKVFRQRRGDAGRSRGARSARAKANQDAVPHRQIRSVYGRPFHASCGRPEARAKGRRNGAGRE